MTWIPFFIALIVFAVVAFALNYGFGNPRFKEGVKRLHQRPLVVVLLLTAMLVTPFFLIWIQN